MQELYQNYYNFCMDQIWDYDRCIEMLQERNVTPENTIKRRNYWEKRAAMVAQKIKR